MHKVEFRRDITSFLTFLDDILKNKESDLRETAVSALATFAPHGMSQSVYINANDNRGLDIFQQELAAIIPSLDNLLKDELWVLRRAVASVLPEFAAQGEPIKAVTSQG